MPSGRGIPATKMINAKGDSCAITHDATIAANIIHMEIDTRRYDWCLPKNRVKISEVINAVEKNHRDDNTKSITPLKGHVGVFKIEAEDYSRYINKTVVIRGIEIDVTPRTCRERGSSISRYPDIEEGTFITILGAFQNIFRHIPNDEFDMYFKNIEGLEVINPTHTQKLEDTGVLNNNRFLVVKREGDIDIGSSMQIRGVKFNLVYEGMQRFCFRCMKKHGWKCPAVEKLEYLKKLRKRKTKKDLENERKNKVKDRHYRAM